VIVINAVLARWNDLRETAAIAAILPCCGSTRWARELAQARPFVDESALFSLSDSTWLRLSANDWDEAFRSHPRIGEHKAPAAATPQSAIWSDKEQSEVDSTDEEALSALARGNRLYEERFGRIFLVCATGKSAAQILEILTRRLENDPQTELRESAEQQRQITQIRLRKWLQS
jgi:2-oxo-4-hydroxy-4-carboxy-5-ureidoimidazoline decarboxylase